MKTIAREQLLDQLQWRYATKQFDPTRKVEAADWDTLEQALLLSPSSLGLQLWRFMIVTDPAVRERLRAAAWGQPQIADASHLVVLTAKKRVTEADIDAHLERIAEVRGLSLDDLAPLRAMAIGSVIQGKDEEARAAWAARQVYIALGTLLTSAAVLGIDACPMEGFDPAGFDEILGLDAQGFTAVAVAAVGYRSATDKYAGQPKVRFPKERVLVHVG